MIAAGCAAGDPRFAEAEPAVFPYGFWHGLIMLITFLISLFSDTTVIYEVNNSGDWYDFGFGLGALRMGGCSATPWTAGKKNQREQEWEELGRKVEANMMDELKTWAEEE